MILKKDGKESRVYGCATQNDCDAAMKACTAAEKNNVRTKCTAKCCAEDNCNNPPNKGMLTLLDIGRLAPSRSLDSQEI